MSDEEIINEYIIATVCELALREYAQKCVRNAKVFEEGPDKPSKLQNIESEMSLARACSSKADEFKKTAYELFGW